MTQAIVRTLGGDDWQIYRQLRLAALQEAPQAFVSTYSDEQAYDADFWQQRMARARRLVAEIGHGSSIEHAGIVSVGQAERPEVGDLYGLWVAPEHRGAGVAMQLVQGAAERARIDGLRWITLWVATENGRAVAFFSSVGFRPTEERRPMAGQHDSAEIAMELAVTEDPNAVPTTAL
jgi:ribosomal protein S18 acetylase RimI-like enzyme